MEGKPISAQNGQKGAGRHDRRQVADHDGPLSGCRSDERGEHDQVDVAELVVTRTRADVGPPEGDVGDAEGLGHPAGQRQGVRVAVEAAPSPRRASASHSSAWSIR